MSKAKIIAIVLAAVLAIVLIAQNTEDVATRFLFFDVTMPRAVLLLVTLILGFAIGMLASGRIRAK